jgi:hypothetical protein
VFAPLANLLMGNSIVFAPLANLPTGCPKKTENH